MQQRKLQELPADRLASWSCESGCAAQSRESLAPQGMELPYFGGQEEVMLWDGAVQRWMLLFAAFMTLRWYLGLIVSLKPSSSAC